MKRLVSVFSVIVLIFIGCVNDSKEAKIPIEASDNVLADFAAILSTDSTNHNILFQRAEYFYQKEDYGSAIKDLISAINYDSTKYQYYHLMADACLDYYRSKEAVMTMEKCISIFPKNVPSLLKLSEIYYILKQFDESLNLCGRITSINPNEAEAYFMMGLNFRAKGEGDKAINAFQTATEIDPELTDAWIILGQIFDERKNPLARDYYDAAVNVDPENISALHSKAFYLQNNGAISEAIDIYRNINVIDKNYIDAYLNCGILYMNLDSLQPALEQFDIMTKVKPQNPIGHFYKGEVYKSLGQTDLARASYQNALNINPNDERAIRAIEKLN